MDNVNQQSAVDASESALGPAAREWEVLGLNWVQEGDQAPLLRVGENRLVITAETEAGEPRLSALCRQLCDSMPLRFTIRGVPAFLFVLPSDASLSASLALPPLVKVYRAGELLALPDKLPAVSAPPILQAAHIVILNGPKLDPFVKGNPLAQFSLRGQAAQFEAGATAALPLFENICLMGQATVWYAPPNAGKTLIALKLLHDAVQAGRINPENVYYINADDSSAGFAEKIRLMDELGVHTLAPGHKGFDPAQLPALFQAMADDQKARGVLIIIDTVKKAASLMDKTKASAFTQACRAAVMAGATIVGFAHTNKQPNAKGGLQYGGTTDLIDDFDAAYIIEPQDLDHGDGERLVAFKRLKARGNNCEYALYAYAAEQGISYAERLASVRKLEPDEYTGFSRVPEDPVETEIVKAIEACISEGSYAKMALGKAAAARTGSSERATIKVIERYTGVNPSEHKWTFTRRDRGAMIYSLLSAAEVKSDLAA